MLGTPMQSTYMPVVGPWASLGLAKLLVKLPCLPAGAAGFMPFGSEVREVGLCGKPTLPNGLQCRDAQVTNWPIITACLSILSAIKEIRPTNR